MNFAQYFVKMCHRCGLLFPDELTEEEVTAVVEDATSRTHLAESF